MWTSSVLLYHFEQCQREVRETDSIGIVRSRWIPALPYAPCLKQRIKDAWEVMRGRAQAVTEG